MKTIGLLLIVIAILAVADKAWGMVALFAALGVILFVVDKDLP